MESSIWRVFLKIWEIACSPTWCRWISRTRPDRLSWSFSRLWRRLESNHATAHIHKTILGGVMARTFQWSWRQWRKSMFSRTITELTVGSLWILLKKIWKMKNLTIKKLLTTVQSWFETKTENLQTARSQQNQSLLNSKKISLVNNYLFGRVFFVSQLEMQLVWISWHQQGCFFFDIVKQLLWV